jgi:hypothetical protein
MLRREWSARCRWPAPIFPETQKLGFWENGWSAIVWNQRVRAKTQFPSGFFENFFFENKVEYFYKSFDCNSLPGFSMLAIHTFP